MRNPSRATLKHRAYSHWFYFWKWFVTPAEMCDMPIPSGIEALIARDIRRSTLSFCHGMRVMTATTDELVAMR